MSPFCLLPVFSFCPVSMDVIHVTIFIQWSSVFFAEFMQIWNLVSGLLHFFMHFYTDYEKIFYFGGSFEFSCCLQWLWMFWLAKFWESKTKIEGSWFCLQLCWKLRSYMHIVCKEVQKNIQDYLINFKKQNVKSNSWCVFQSRQEAYHQQPWNKTCTEEITKRS